MSQVVDPGVVLLGAARIAGLSALAAGVAAAAAMLYRWYARGRLPAGLAVLGGLAAVAVYLNTTAALGQVIGGARGLLDLEAAAVNSATFLAAGAAALAGRGIGDRLVRAVAAVTGASEIDADVGRLVSAVGRVITVTIPEGINDIEGYDPVPEATKAALAGRTLVFPRRLTVAELRDRVIARLKEDHDVGHVDLDLDDEGTVEYLALGSRAAGIGPTIAPGTGVTAVVADPPFSASFGDVVGLWAGDERVALAEVRATAGDLVTLALDEAEAEALDPARRYRLLTLPTDPRPDREFAALLRAADETMGVATVAAGSALVGTPVGALDPAVVAVRSAGGVEAIPPRDRVIAAGDTLYAVARPEALRRLEAAAA